MKRTNAQNARFHALLTQRKLDKEEKQALVLTYTRGRSDSSAEMTTQEMAEAIKHLEGEQLASIKKMRAKVINIAKEIFGVADMSQVEWDNLNTFLVNKYKAKLNELDYETLRKAVTSMQMWKKSVDKKRSESTSDKTLSTDSTADDLPTKPKPFVEPRWLVMSFQNTVNDLLKTSQEYQLRAQYLERKIANANPVDINDVHDLREAEGIVTHLTYYYSAQPFNRQN